MRSSLPVPQLVTQLTLARQGDGKINCCSAFCRPVTVRRSMATFIFDRKLRQNFTSCTPRVWLPQLVSVVQETISHSSSGKRDVLHMAGPRPLESEAAKRRLITSRRLPRSEEKGVAEDLP